jgi:hypothetical protein
MANSRTTIFQGLSALAVLVILGALLLTAFYAILLSTLGGEPRVLDWRPLARGFVVAVCFLSVLSGAVILLESSGVIRNHQRIGWTVFGFAFGFGGSFLPHMDAFLFGELGSPGSPRPLWVKLGAGAVFGALYAFQARREKRLSRGSNGDPTPSLPPRPFPD